MMDIDEPVVFTRQTNLLSEWQATGSAREEGEMLSI